MTANGWIPIATFCAAVLVCVKPLGLYMARVFEGEIRFLGPLERGLYRVAGVKGEEQHWTQYTIAMLAFSIAGFVSLYFIQRLQAALPFNPPSVPRYCIPARLVHKKGCWYSPGTFAPPPTCPLSFTAKAMLDIPPSVPRSVTL